MFKILSPNVQYGLYATHNVIPVGSAVSFDGTSANISDGADLLVGMCVGILGPFGTMVQVAHGQFTAETDQYDKKGVYMPGFMVAVNSQGLLCAALGKTIGYVLNVGNSPSSLIIGFDFQTMTQLGNTSATVKNQVIDSLPAKTASCQDGAYCQKCNTFNEYITESNWTCYSCRNG